MLAANTLIEFQGPPHHRKRLPMSAWFIAYIDIRIEVSIRMKMTCRKTEAITNDVICHVEQRRERPYVFKLFRQFHQANVITGNECCSLMQEPRFRQLLLAFCKYMRSRLDAKVMAILEILNYRDATPKGSTTNINQEMFRFQSDTDQEVDLKVPFHFPEFWRSH